MKFRLLLNKLKIPGNMFFSPYLGVLPDPNVDIVVLVAKAMKFPLIKDPSAAEIKKYLEEYINYVTDVFNINKDFYDSDPNTKLTLVTP